uniref:DUF4042 domain-containing protein n=1 Tax=Ascaris lumbricoides TaxID=6252 RepID=A0A0M3IEL6_ASCLU
MVHIFEWRASAIRLISSAADEAARDLVEGMHEPSVSLLCLKYANALLSHICISGDSWQLIRSARLVTALLDLCNEKTFFATACLMNNQMISLLDRNDTKCTPAVLRAMISFVIDVTQWFPNEKEEEEVYDDEENSEMNTTKRRIPEFVSAIITILKRTKHLTSSRELRNRLLVLKLLKLSLEALANFPNRLCPLVHENWPGVKSNAIGNNFLARKQAFKVIVTMCETTGSFMYRRFKGEVWPSIQESMTKLLDDEERPGGGNLISETYKYQRSILKQYVIVTMCETTGSFMYRRFKGEVWPSIQESMTKLLDDEERPGGGNLISETYKYQRSILKHLLSIWKSIDPLAEDWESVRRMLLIYASSGLLSIWKSIDPLAEDWEGVRRMLLIYASSGCVKKDLVALANDSLQELAQVLK